MLPYQKVTHGFSSGTTIIRLLYSSVSSRDYWVKVVQQNVAQYLFRIIRRYSSCMEYRLRNIANCYIHTGVPNVLRLAVKFGIHSNIEGSCILNMNFRYVGR